MDSVLKQLLEWTEEISEYEMPSWASLPDIDLYMDQVISYMEKQTDIFIQDNKDKLISPAMINNYVKSGMIPRPVKKRYSREHIGYLLAACILKQVLPIPHIAKLMSSQTDQMDMPEVFEEFRTAQHSAMCEVSKVVKESVDRMDQSSPGDFENDLNMLALKLTATANANKIAAEHIIYLMGQSKDLKSSKSDVRE